MSEPTIEYNPSYDDVDRQNVAAINAWITGEEGRRQADLCKRSGVKPGTLSQILSGQYPSSPSKWLTKALDVVQRDQSEQRDLLRSIPYCETGITQNMLATIARAHADGDFAVWTAAVGTGKTTALKRYNARGNSALIEAFEGISHTTFLRMLADQVGLVVGGYFDPSHVTLQIANKLADRDFVILVDEAQWPQGKSLNALRRISDIAQVGVALFGNPELLTKVRDSADPKFGQIASRTPVWMPTAQRMPDEDLALMAGAYLAKVEEEVGDDVITQFVASSKGSGRALRNLMRSTVRACRKKRTAITTHLIVEIDTKTGGA